MAISGPSGFIGRGLPPTGLAALLARPGLRDALMATGSALLSQRDQPGSLGGALGRALPMGMQAMQQGQQKAAYEQLLASAPPEMRQLLTMLGPERGIPALLQLMQPKPKPDPKVVGRSLVDPVTGAVIYSEPGEADAPPDLPAEVRTALFTLGLTPDDLTPEQRDAVVERIKELAEAGRTTVNVGTGDVSKLPVGVQSGIVGAQGVRSALDRFEGYAEEWFKLPATKRAAGQVGLPDPERDVVLGNLDSVRQELILNLKNLVELGVLAGPDMDILNQMIGDPTNLSALVRSPEFTMTRINRVREFVENKIKAYERTYGITVPGAEPPAPSALPDPLGIRRPGTVP